jgi:hypothetical protein
MSEFDGGSQTKLASEIRVNEGKRGPRAVIKEIIANNFDQQPKTTKDIWQNHQDLFNRVASIDGKIWLFSNNYGDKVMALVNSDEETNIFYPRFFRLSGSDHQFKSYPGYRANGDALKGDETDGNHHYVQSAKLDHRVIKVIQDLPKVSDHQKRGLISSFMPVMANQKIGSLGKNLEDFKFSEKQVEFKNKDWQKIKDKQKYFFDVYEYLNYNLDKKIAKTFYNALRKNADHLEVDTQGMVEAMKAIPNKSDEWTMADIFSNKDAQIVDFRNMMSMVAQKTVEKLFQNREMEELMKKSNFIPDFNQNPINSYIKTDGKNKIMIETFKVTSPEGDVLCWEMATDEHGRIYIDNIYDPRVGTDSYGTPAKKSNFGMLIYKPEDYSEQTPFVPSKYKGDPSEDRDFNDYVDISELLGLSLPVRMFRQSSTAHD